MSTSLQRTIQHSRARRRGASSPAPATPPPREPSPPPVDLTELSRVGEAELEALDVALTLVFAARPPPVPWQTGTRLADLIAESGASQVDRFPFHPIVYKPKVKNT